MLNHSLIAALFCCGTVVLHSAPLKKETKPQQCIPDSKHMRASVRHIEAGGIGYNKGYSTLETFIASDPNQWAVMPFLDARWHIFNDGKMDVNAGLGIRSQLGCRAYGINCYYDYRNTHHRGYNQVGLGLETLGSLWDLRVNGYLPVGGKISNPYNIQFGGFEGRSILVNRKFEYAMKGIDGEIGFHFGQTSNFDFYAAAGPYYFKGELGRGAIGGKARVAGYYKEYVTLELSDSLDSVFHNNIQGQLTLSFSFGPKSRSITPNKRCSDSCDYSLKMLDRMVQPVARQEIVVIDHHTKNDPASIGVIFVDNTSSSAGTYESPYPTMAEAIAASGEGDIIYVFPGDGTSTGLNAGSSSYVLKNDQQLLGAATTHTVSTNLGTVTIPAQATLRPYLTANANTNVLQVANGNVISGLHIVVPGGAATIWAIGSSSDIHSLSITDNLLQAQGDQVYLINLGNDLGSPIGDINISNNLMLTNIASTYGIYAVHASSEPLNFSLTNNQISGFSSDSLYLNSNSGVVTATIANNQFLNASTDYAFEFDLHGDTQVTADVRGNIIQGTYGCGLFPNENSQLTMNLTDNEIYVSRMAINTELLDNSILNLNAANNTLYSDGENQYLVYLYPSDESVINASFRGNIMTVSSSDDFSYGIYVESYNNTTVNLQSIGNTISAAGYSNPYCFYLLSDDDAIVNATIQDSLLRAIDGDEDGLAIYTHSRTNSRHNLTVKNCGILASRYGMLLDPIDGSRLAATIENNTVGLTPSAQSALEVRSSNSATVDLVCNFNTLNGNQSLSFPCNGTGGFTASCANNQLNGESNSAVVTVSNTSTGTMTVSLASNGIIGFAGHDNYVAYASSNGGGVLYLDFENNSLTSGGYGLFGNSHGDGASLVARVISNHSETLQGDSITAETGAPSACVSYQNNTGNASNTFTNSGMGTFTLYYIGNNQPATGTSITTGDANSCQVP